MADETLQYSGTFDGTQILGSLKQTDAAFLQTEQVATKAFAEISSGSKVAVQGVDAVSKAEVQAARSAVEMGEAHALSFRTINRAATEGSRGVQTALMSIQTGSLESAGAMDVFRIALGAAFHGPQTLLIVAAAAAIGFLVEKLHKAGEEARDVKWYGDPGEVTERFETLKAEYAQLVAYQDRLNDSTQQYNYANSTARQQAYGKTKEAKENLAVAEKLKINLDAQLKIEGQIATIEADKIRLRSETALKVAEAGNDPIAKMRAENAGIVAEKTREQEQLQLLIQEHELQAQVLHEQLAVKAKSKEEMATEGQNKIKLQKLDMQLNSENEIYKAKGDELVNLVKTQSIDIANAQGKKKAWFDGMQTDTEASPAYLAQLQAQKEATLKYNQEIGQIQADAKAASISEYADEFTVKAAILDAEFEKRRETYEREAVEEADRSGDRVAAEQRLGEKLELLDSLHSQKRRNIEADRVKKTEELNASLNSALIADGIGLFQALGAQGKAFFLAQKALAAVQVVVDTQAAAAKIEAQLGIGAAFGPEEALYTGMALKLATIAATSIQGFAAGTDSAPPGMAWVGEHGPELMRFRGGEQVYPHETSVAMARNTFNSGGNVSIGAIHIHGSGLSQSQLTEAVTEGVLGAKGQQERNRDADFMNDGTMG